MFDINLVSLLILTVYRAKSKGIICSLHKWRYIVFAEQSYPHVHVFIHIDRIFPTKGNANN